MLFYGRSHEGEPLIYPMSLNIGARLLILLTEQINNIVNRQNFMRAKSSMKIAVVYFFPFRAFFKFKEFSRRQKIISMIFASIYKKDL